MILRRIADAVRVTWWLWRETKRQMPDSSREARTMVMRRAHAIMLERNQDTKPKEG